MGLEKVKVALVHDWLVGTGGGEEVLYDFHSIFPDAPIYTLVYDDEKAPAWTRECEIRTTYLQEIPGAKTHHKLLLPLMPQAWEALDLTSYDLVLSSCSSCCKGVITSSSAKHVCYCHTPTRYLWDLYYDYLKSAPLYKQLAMPYFIHKVRQWDYLAAQRVDYFMTNSHNVAKRINKYYRRDSEIIYPGIKVSPLSVPSERDDFYLVVSRLVSYKRVDLAVRACTQLGRPLIVVGEGEELPALKEIAGPTVTFAGFLNDDEKWLLYSGAKALLFPGKEDFGLTPVEAMSAGCPIIAFGEGGALETVIDKKTGLFFYEQTADALVRCIEEFENGQASGTSEISLEAMVKRARQFSREAFRENIKLACERAIESPEP